MELRTKICESCNSVFPRNRKFDRKQWKDVRFCSRKCAGILVAERSRGKKLSLSTRIKISLSNSGTKNHKWKHGLSLSPYPMEFSRELKSKIRERDSHICQICGVNQQDNFLDVHHIDYNKINCAELNLITLCRSCHIKTNFNRNNWIDKFTKIIHEIYVG